MAVLLLQGIGVIHMENLCGNWHLRKVWNKNFLSMSIKNPVRENQMSQSRQRTLTFTLKTDGNIFSFFCCLFHEVVTPSHQRSTTVSAKTYPLYQYDFQIDYPLAYSENPNQCSANREIFIWVSNVMPYYLGFPSLHYVLVPENVRHFLNQSESKLKPIT